MMTDLFKRVCGTALAILLVVSAVPAGADTVWTTKNQFDLQLGKSLDDEAIRVESGAARIASAEMAQQIASQRLNLVQRQTVSGIGQQLLMQSSGSQDTSKRNGTGRWLKKHWYVPVLVAVALGASLEVGDSKDDVDDD